MADFNLLDANTFLSVSGLILLGLLILIVFGGLAVMIYFMYFKKDQPKLTLIKIDDFKLNYDLAKIECPPSCSNKKIGLSGDGRHMKSVLGTIRGLRTMAVLKDIEGKPVDIMFCTYLPVGENELVYSLLGKELKNIVFAEPECDGLVGDITLRGINMEIYGLYTVLVSNNISGQVISDYLDARTAQSRVKEVWANLADIIQFAVRCDAQHHKTIEESATTAQSQQSNQPIQPTVQR